MRIPIVAVIMGIGLLSAASAEAGEWKVCNRETEKRNVAIAYVNPGSGGFISEGWWTIQPCACKTVLLRTETSDPRNVFLRAEAPGGFAVIDGSSRMCGAQFKHTIVGNDRCVARGFQDLTYKHLVVDLDKHWTTNIVGSGGRCQTIDP